MRVRPPALIATAVLVTGMVLTLPVPAAEPAPLPAVTDYCGGQCADILPPGQNGNATLAEILAHRTLGTRPRHAADQLGKYAALADHHRGLTTGTISRFFNDASFGVPPEQVESRVSPRADVTIIRDRTTGVPHVFGTTRSGTTFGAGYAAAQDRLWLMDIMRRVGRGQLTPFAGGADANRSLEQRFFSAAPYTEEELRQQIDTVARSGPRGAQGLADARSYVEGINTYIRQAHRGRYFPGEYVLTGHVDAITNAGRIDPFTLTDLVVLASVVGAQFGGGGGGEVRAAIAKLAVQERYGLARGEEVWRSLRAEDDPEAVRTLHDGQRFPYGRTPANARGRAMPEPGSVTPQQLVFDRTGSAAGSAAPERVPAPEELEPARGMFTDGVLPANLLEQRHGMSNALVVSGRHSESGHPVAVFGPQTGYFAPQLLMLQELQGPGISARGASFAGLSFYVLLGRGQDYAWSATTSAQDIIDTYAVELCEPSGAPATKESNAYRFRGECRPMDVVERRNAWRPSVADPTPAGSYTLRGFRTVYGPVTHRAVVDGKPVAYAALRSTFLHEVDSLLGFQEFNDPDAIRSAQDFQRAAAKVNFTFNWFYADADDTAYFNSGANPRRSPVVDPSMPIRGDAGFDWRGWNPEGNVAEYTPFAEHPRSVNQDYYISWNNAQALEYAAAGYEKSSVHRGDLLDRRVRELVADGGKVNRGELTSAMAEAGLADLRVEQVLPELLRVIDTAPTSEPAVATLRAWAAAGGLRQETRPGSQEYAHAEAIKIMDAWWPLLVRAQFEPGMGSAAFDAMVGVLQINESPSGFQNEVPGKRVGQPHQGSAYQAGWWGYVHKDVRALLGDPVRGPLGARFCGGGDLERCRQVLLDTLRQAVAQPIAEVYPGDADCAAGDQWCADSLVHRPLGGITHDKISTQNRPTFQQVVEFPSRR
ncbi:Penicillin amidase [Amycolatopsis arida]|uniref:Penicillin amidase n=1 Tax=Amycolatopsis arida TaxID=587909 RepID=A0A1I5TX54_9PSEU|nr:penicillin acylase family protein [Amycolatopsis arida]TDX95934.1 penicillin amidase [Amycolatopsis arida]SFP87471.1 Penicillin amidase [Amycolatopsis arida]